MCTAAVARTGRSSSPPFCSHRCSKRVYGESIGLQASDRMSVVEVVGPVGAPQGVGDLDCAILVEAPNPAPTGVASLTSLFRYITRFPSSQYASIAAVGQFGISSIFWVRLLIRRPRLDRLCRQWHRLQS